MISGEISPESWLSTPLEVLLPDLMERTATILQKLRSAEHVDAVCPEVAHDLRTLCDAEQVILYAVGRETRDLYVKFACEPCAGKWAERIPIATDNVHGGRDAR